MDAREVRNPLAWLDEPAGQAGSVQAAEPPPAAGPGDDKAERVGAAPTSTPAASLDFSAWVPSVAPDGRRGWTAPDAPPMAWWKVGDFESLATDWKGAIRQALRRGRRR